MYLEDQAFFRGLLDSEVALNLSAKHNRIILAAIARDKTEYILKVDRDVQRQIYNRRFI